jgi:AcrR family transcriptional regulator
MNLSADVSSTEQRILEAAAEVVQRFGVRASMNEIAEAAGVSRQTLYLKFGDRAGLFSALIKGAAAMDPGLVAMWKALDLPALDAFETFFSTWIRTAIRRERYLRVFWRNAEADPEMMKAVRGTDEALYQKYVELFRKLRAAGLLRSIWTADEAADAAYGTTMYGVFVGHLRTVRGWPPEQILAQGMKVLRATFLTDEAQSADAPGPTKATVRRHARMRRGPG